MSPPRHTVSLLLDEGLLPLSRVVGTLRRKNLAIASVAVGPSRIPGCSRLTVQLDADEAAADQVVRQLRKVIAVRHAVLFAGEHGVRRELALISVRHGLAQRDRLLETLGRFQAAVAEERPGVVVVEAAGRGSAVAALIQALEPFGIIDVARSEAVVFSATSWSLTGDGPDASIHPLQDGLS